MFPAGGDVTSSLVGVRLRTTLHEADDKIVVAMAWISMRDESRMQGGNSTSIVIPIELGPLRGLERSHHRTVMITDRHTVLRLSSTVERFTRLPRKRKSLCHTCKSKCCPSGIES